MAMSKNSVKCPLIGTYLFALKIIEIIPVRMYLTIVDNEDLGCLRIGTDVVPIRRQPRIWMSTIVWPSANSSATFFTVCELSIMIFIPFSCLVAGIGAATESGSWRYRKILRFLSTF